MENKQPRKLYRTDVTIWTEFPTHHMSLHQLGREAETGEGYCDARTCEVVTDTTQFPDTHFFAIPPLEDEDAMDPSPADLSDSSPDTDPPTLDLTGKVEVEQTPKPERCDNCGESDKLYSAENHDADYPYIEWVCDGCGCVHD